MFLRVFLYDNVSQSMTLFQWCACANMEQLSQYWRKLHDVGGGATDTGQPRALFLNPFCLATQNERDPSLLIHPHLCYM